MKYSEFYTAVLLCSMGAAGAEELALDEFPRLALSQNTSSPPASTSSQFSSSKSEPFFSDANNTQKSYAIPAAEIVGFDFLVNRINERVNGGDYEVTSRLEN